MTASSLSQVLHSSLPVGASLVVVFVPSKDRENKPIDQDMWVDEVLTMLGKAFRGATAYPRGRGVWRDDERGGVLVREEPVIVFSLCVRRVLDCRCADIFVRDAQPHGTRDAPRRGWRGDRWQILRDHKFIRRSKCHAKRGRNSAGTACVARRAVGCCKSPWSARPRATCRCRSLGTRGTVTATRATANLAHR